MEYAAALEGLVKPVATIRPLPGLLDMSRVQISAAHQIEHLVCPCNTVWGVVGPIPECPYHGNQFIQPVETFVTTTLLPFIMPLDTKLAGEIFQELIENLLGPLAD